MRRRFLASLAALGLLPMAAHAQNQEIRLAQQFSMGYLQLNVMQHQNLIEKHATALGLKDVKVSWAKFNGPTAVNEALISGNLDFASGGIGPFVTIWARWTLQAVALVAWLGRRDPLAEPARGLGPGRFRRTGV